MKTSDQIAQDLEALFKHMEYERVRDDAEFLAMYVSEAQHRAIMYKPKPFEFAKLEQWKPSKHAKK